MGENKSEREYWDQLAKRYDASLGPLGRPMIRAVKQVAEAAQGTDSVMEVAAGTGLFATTLAASANKVIATDYSGAMVEQLERKIDEAGLTNVRYEQADIYSLPYDPGIFGVVVAANVLHLVPDYPAALDAIRKTLKPGGLLVTPRFPHAFVMLPSFSASSTMLSLRLMIYCCRVMGFLL